MVRPKTDYEDEDEEILNAVPQANDTYSFGGSRDTEDEY